MYSYNALVVAYEPNPISANLYGISLHPEGSLGLSAAKHYANRETLSVDLQRLGVTGANLSILFEALKPSKPFPLLNLHLSDEEAQYFGWVETAGQ